ncbi:protein-L-isoaspartate O-methyltransferase family protein [Henriciella algicola]|uniref:Protein-L-isoaspartate O-methyltransferase n=1 Tax=Henriciella algicola TaxID=1608422 RepID=A0A399RCD0_9PROT|nr:protein-L-isoaspartate O-methyltransferase [Henriciella algicola]RIJ29098.1 protein-L-isoaspartate O-methyltransferase [Henriciella algicola]
MDFAKMRRIMVDSQIRPNDVTDPEIVSAFLRTPREAFVPKSAQSIAYAECEIETSEGRSLWTPRDIGKMIKSLDPQPNDIALVIGAGAGYETAILSHLCETVIALEEDEDLVDELTAKLASLDYDRAVAVQGDLREGLADQAPFDIILVCGLIEQAPEAWFSQLAEGGRLGAPVVAGRDLGRARIWTKAGETVSYREVFDCCPPGLAGFEKPKSFVF